MTPIAPLTVPAIEPRTLATLFSLAGVRFLPAPASSPAVARPPSPIRGVPPEPAAPPSPPLSTSLPVPVPVPVPVPAPAPVPLSSSSPLRLSASGAAPAPLDALRAAVAACTRCQLHAGRTQTVFADGNPAARLMFVGEGPGAEEDRQGVPFVGPAGQLLTKIIEAMGLRRADVYIANVVKCRPPDNRVPEPDEMAACLPYLREQIVCVQPRAIVALGTVALRGLFGEGAGGITRSRGTWKEFQGIPVMPTFHPAYLLRNPADKKLVWADMKLVRDRIGDAAGAPSA